MRDGLRHPPGGSTSGRGAVEYLDVVGSPVARALRWFVRLWSTDLADPAQRIRLRARLVAAGCPIAALAAAASLVSSAPTGGAHRRLVQIGVMAALVLMSVGATIWGSRMGDRSFSLLVYGGLLLSVVGVVGTAAPGSVMRAAVAFVIDTVIGAIFFERRRWVVGGLVIALGLLVLTAYLASDTGYLVMDLSIAVVSIGVIGVSVRLLRELAVSALLESRRSEVTDPLTGLMNRRGLERMIGPYWQGQAGAGRRVLVLLVDVDHFKRINDTRGHAHGDEVLRRLGEVLSASLRSGDAAIRLGGEEFLLLCDCPQGEAERIAERLRRAIEDQLRPITVSIGAFETQPETADRLPESVWSAVDAADSALYEAKGSGRNRVVLSPRDPIGCRAVGSSTPAGTP
jgi:diguanylate cyclase (GGDEF)-like protein